MRQAELQLRTTTDGSTTLYDARRQLYFRSRHGAATESRGVFVGATGVVTRHARPVRILELGFGGATNFCETVAALMASGRHLVSPAQTLDYLAVDAAPAPPQWLHHPCAEAVQTARAAASGVQAEWSHRCTVEAAALGVRLTLIRAPFTQLPSHPLAAHAIYFDPFAPRVDPESWSVEIFRSVRRHMHADGVLSTYSAASWIRRNMQAAGLIVARAPAPKPKREMTIAACQEHVLRTQLPAALAAQTRLWRAGRAPENVP